MEAHGAMADGFENLLLGGVAAMTLLEKMLRIRTIELEIAMRYPEGKMRTPVHLSVGQEAPAVGVCAALQPGDQVVSTHRSHAHYLAMGGDLKAMLCELYGKRGGCSGGHGGSMHLVDRSVGFMGSTSIVGGTIPIGVGLAFAKKMRKESGIVVVFHGDGACEQGVWHESLNFASLHKLPVLFVCENNGFSCNTHISERQPDRTIIRMAQGHGLQVLWTNTMYPEVIASMAANLRSVVLADGPCFLEVQTCRMLEHCGPNMDDRDPEMLRHWQMNDPLQSFAPTAEMLEEITAAFKAAEADEYSEPVGMYAD